jgi:hypothetical protein
MMPRRLLRLPGSALLLAALGAFGFARGAAAADVEFVRVWPGWHAAVDFTRISEYFDHRENLSGREVRRSHPQDRAGFYFLTRVKHPNVSLMGAKFVLRVVTPASPDPVQYTFPAAVGAGEHLFEIGLTGPDWSGRKEHPVAWRLELVDDGGHTLAQAQSVLWAMPEPAAAAPRG